MREMNPMLGHRGCRLGITYHEIYDKPFLRWKVPAQPPPDLDLTPYPTAR